MPIVLPSLLLSFCIMPSPASVAVTTPAPAAHAQTTPPQTPPAPAPAPRTQTSRPAARPAARTTMVITVTDPSGATLPGIQIAASGPADREGETDDSGMLRFTNMRAGSYRLRFSGEGVVAFEREVAVRAGQTADVDVTLNPAPETPVEAPAPEAPPAPAPAPVGPPGDPRTVDVPDFAERNYVGRQPRRESPIACSGNARTMLIQLNEPQPERLYDGAESMYYVVAGEGSIRIDGRETPLAAGTYAVVPRGMSHGFTRRGRNPLILLAILSGEPCQAQ